MIIPSRSMIVTFDHGCQPGLRVVSVNFKNFVAIRRSLGRKAQNVSQQFFDIQILCYLFFFQTFNLLSTLI